MSDSSDQQSHPSRSSSPSGFTARSSSSTHPGSSESELSSAASIPETSYRERPDSKAPIDPQARLWDHLEASLMPIINAHLNGFRELMKDYSSNTAVLSDMKRVELAILELFPECVKPKPIDGNKTDSGQARVVTAWTKSVNDLENLKLLSKQERKADTARGICGGLIQAMNGLHAFIAPSPDSRGIGYGRHKA